MKTYPWYRTHPRRTDRPADVSAGSGEDRLAEPQAAAAVARWIA